MKFLLILAFATCGLAFTVQRKWPERIVGGSLASEGQLPYTISLRYTGLHNCGGSIMDQRTILTAAHCVKGFPQENLTVVVGSLQINEGGNTHLVNKVTIHPDWTADTRIADLAVLKLNSSIQYTQNVQQIAIANQFSEAGVDCVISGWGFTSYPGSTPNDLYYLNTKVVSLQKCQEDFASEPEHPVTVGNVCTFSQYGQGTCPGDSGGPLVVNDEQIGVSSWLEPCGVGFSDVFISTAYYRSWIESHME